MDLQVDAQEFKNVKAFFAKSNDAISSLDAEIVQVETNERVIKNIEIPAPLAILTSLEETIGTRKWCEVIFLILDKQTRFIRKPPKS